MKNPLMMAVSTAMIPPASAAAVFGSDLVHSLKLQLKSISGMAMGTVMFMIIFWVLRPVLPSSKWVSPKRAGIMPTA